MSDSSEDEDLSRFREAVDNSFTQLFNERRGKDIDSKETGIIKSKSERYLEEASHYNDIKVPEVLQKQIAAKVSSLINKNIKFVDVEPNRIKKCKIKGGVKLFKDSNAFLSCDEPKDTYTELHNAKSRKLKKSKRQLDLENDIDQNEKLKLVTVSGEYVISKEEIKCWKSRRKEKLYKYKKVGKILTSIE